MALKILITGSKGQLGSEFQVIFGNYKNFNFIFTDIEELDITDKNQLDKLMKKEAIECVINCAAYTAVDKAEDEMEKARLINKTAVSNLAEVTSNHKALLVHISTDYVFDGKNCKPYLETDNTNPRCFYGKSKLEGEIEIIFNAAKAIIIRTSWLYSSFGNNFVKTIFKKGKEKGSLQVVYDQVGSPTYARDLAETILNIIPRFQSSNRAEIYNYSNEGVISWYDFAKAIIEIKGIKCEIQPIETKNYPTPAVRPFYSVLNKSKIKKDYDIQIPYWKDSLIKCLNEING
jgi:dTDP-4-dehydrorhamnose reductase